MNTPDKSVVFVVGMHRSGTSALTQLLGAIGAELGHDLIDAAFDNPEGFFEHRRLVELNNAIFEKLGLHWDATVPLPEHWLDHPEIRILQEQAVQWLRSEFGEAPLIALKDPRLCRTLPFWLEAAESAGRKATAVHLFRDIREIAHSFAVREQTDHRKAVVLSVLYLAEAVEATAALPRVALHYDALFADLPGCLDTLYTLPVPWPMPRAEAGTKATTVIKPKLRNNTAPDVRAHLDSFLNTQLEALNACINKRSFFSTPELAQQLQSSYCALREKITAAQETWGFWHNDAMQAHSLAVQLHTAHLQNRERQSMLDNYMLHAKQLEELVQQLQVTLTAQAQDYATQLAQKESLLAQKENELALIYNSRGWKILQALRRLKNQLCRALPKR